jgi:hypothetical protein
MANDYFNHVSNVIASGVRALAAQVNNIATEIATGLDKLPTEVELKRGLTRFAVDTGAADAYVVTLPYVPALVDGLEVNFRPVNANTGPSTVNVNALGAKAIVTFDLTALDANSIVANSMCTMRYSSVGDHFILISGAAAIQSINTANNLALVNDATDATNFVLFANNATGDQAIKTNAALTFDAATGALASSSFTTGDFFSNAIQDDTDGIDVELWLRGNGIQIGPNNINKHALSRAGTTGEMHLGGSASSFGAATGGHVVLYGISHSTAPGDAEFGSIDTLFTNRPFMYWDESVGDLEFSTGVGVKTNALTIAANQAATFAGAVTVQGAFTSLGIDDNATAERLQLADSNLTIGETNTEFILQNVSSTRALVLSGGTSNILGANIRLFSESEASNASDMFFRAGANTWMQWDESVGDLEILTGAGVKASALTVTSSTLLTGPSATAANYIIGRNSATAALHVSGGAGGVNGANILLYGSAHASTANDMLFRQQGNVWMRWDESVGDLEILTGTGVKASALTINASQLMSGLNLLLNGTGTTEVIRANANATGNIAGYFYSNTLGRTQPLIFAHNDNGIGSGQGFRFIQDQGGDAFLIENNNSGISLRVDANSAGARGAYFYSNTASRVQALVDIVNDNATGSGVAARIQQDQGGEALAVVNNGAGAAMTVNALDVGLLIDVQVFEADGTWTRPAGCKRAEVWCVGGGGGGAGALATGAGQVAFGRAGGGAGMSYKHITSGLGATETIQVGVGGAGGTSGGSGTSGEATTFGSHLTANGGGAGVAEGTSSAPMARVGGAGGAAHASGDYSIPGGAGHLGIAISTSIFWGGEGGESGMGNIFSNSSPIINSSPGNGRSAAAGAYGCGGQGGANDPSNSANAGGAGEDGLCIVKAYA